MKQALLDVNVLIALLDGAHIHHARAMDWLTRHLGGGGKWASCPITQNGCIRIMSQPAYPNARNPVDIAARLRDAASTASHVFWVDELSLLTAECFDWQHLFHSRQLTDAYLLALAVAHDGVFITFDHAMPVQAVREARSDNLLML